MGPLAAVTPPVFSHSTFSDASGITIHTYAWLPESPIGVIQLSHGIGEHARRYDHVAEFFAARGYAVYADDHRGHGETGRQQTGGNLARLGRLGPGGLAATEEAILTLTSTIRATHPDLPLVYLGHSWGSLMGQRIINREAHPFDGVILSGSAYRMPGFMESGDLNGRHAHLGTTGYEWLSRDQRVHHAFASDELCFTANIPKLFGIADALRLFGVPGRHVANVPMLIFSGSEDPLSLKDSLERLAAGYRNRGVDDVTLRVYPGGRHEMFNELNREDVLADVAAWLDEHVRVTQGGGDA